MGEVDINVDNKCRKHLSKFSKLTIMYKLFDTQIMNVYLQDLCIHTGVVFRGTSTREDEVHSIGTLNIVEYVRLFNFFH